MYLDLKRGLKSLKDEAERLRTGQIEIDSLFSEETELDSKLKALADQGFEK